MVYPITADVQMCRCACACVKNTFMVPILSLKKKTPGGQRFKDSTRRPF